MFVTLNYPERVKFKKNEQTSNYFQRNVIIINNIQIENQIHKI